MTFNSKAAQERQLIDLTDDELVAIIGSTWELIKRLEEAMSTDPAIQDLQDQITQLKHERYLDTRKSHKATLRAARALANAKGIQFSLPGEKDGHK